MKRKERPVINLGNRKFTVPRLNYGELHELFLDVPDPISQKLLSPTESLEIVVNFYRKALSFRYPEVAKLDFADLPAHQLTSDFFGKVVTALMEE